MTCMYSEVNMSHDLYELRGLLELDISYLYCNGLFLLWWNLIFLIVHHEPVTFIRSFLRYYMMLMNY